MARITLCAGFAAMTVASASAQSLPKWTDVDRARLQKGEIIVGTILLVDDPKVSELPKVDKDVIVAVPEPEIPEPPYDPTEIPEEFIKGYFASKPSGFLVDPQRLLSKQETDDREAFLEYHAEESIVDIKLYLFDSEQQIPSEYTLHRLVEEQYADGELTAVIFYYLGNPSRNQLAFAGKGAEEMTTEGIRRILESSILKAEEKSDPSDQIEAFVVQTSIKLYWIERAITEEQEQQRIASAVPTKPSSDTPKPEKPGMADQIKPFLLYLAVAVGGVLLTVVGLCGSFLLWKKNRKYHFPVLELPRRLGADYAAGVGAVIAFHNKQGSPSSQRDQVPDYLSRV